MSRNTVNPLWLSCIEARNIELTGQKDGMYDTKVHLPPYYEYIRDREVMGANSQGTPSADVMCLLTRNVLHPGDCYGSLRTIACGIVHFPKGRA